MAKRVSRVVISEVTKEQFETALGSYATAEAQESTLLAKMEKEITRIREKFASDLNEWAKVKEERFEIIQTYCEEQKAELFVKKKSIETVHGTLGFRTGTPSLKQIKGFTVASTTNLLKEFLPAYVRIKEEPAKDKLLANLEEPEVAENLERVGLSVVQDEHFFIELKKEEAAAVA